ncbi:Protein-cysteine N-palmitoyltransferase HHAT [Acropora cervicornis]|uniref:Protein-cysteine N-palmitoyltransferase HHAT n=1 Tax=Acropora cervicornis TaxID=6130 RepID=A0AAD9QX05_ACRCE|nr:Protein-cysteine N-palmitoyltransferase HHAT [Acropora cervicornis]
MSMQGNTDKDYYYCRSIKMKYMRGIYRKSGIFLEERSPFSAFCSRWYFVFSSWDGSLWLSCSVTASLSLEFALSSNLSSCCGYAVLEFQSLFKSIQLEIGNFGLEYCWRVHERQEDEQPEMYSLLDLLVFNFYFPVFVNGPVITFETFQNTFYQPHRHFSREEIISLVKDVIRTVWWYIFLEGFLHFVYATAFTQEPEIFKSLSNWALCGILYSMLQIFLVKYKVFYLGAGLFARMDGVTVPLPPRCVSTLYLFSDMWKYFDRGLHIWMMRYIYIPMGGSRRGIFRQLLASMCAFGFIWQWHGGHVNMLLWWFIPNWLGVVAESWANVIATNTVVRQWEEKLSPAASRRVRAVFGVFTVSFLILTNMVFLCGIEPVWFYIKRMLYYGWPSSTVLLLFAMYLVVQTNMELNRLISSW